MFLVLQVLTVCLVAIGVSLSVAHALELPGKMRLDREAYLTTQPIYYPGFTIGGGVGEFGGLVATLVLLVATPRGSDEFAWTLMALAGLIAMHAAYWVFTHPVNQFWLRERPLQRFSRGFFRFDPMNRTASAGGEDEDWQRLRRRWEYSHVLRALLGGAAFLCLVVAVAI